ncbi:hypothetical protein D3C87_148610 [compost metagenome]
MKKIIILFSILAITVLQACKKDPSPGDNFDFSNSLAPYVTITSLDDVEVEPGKVASIDLQMRTSIQQKVTVTYKVEGAINIPSATAVFEKEAKDITVSLTAPLIVAPATSAEATFTLLKAQTADGRALTIGQNADAAAQKVTIIIE